MHVVIFSGGEVEDGGFVREALGKSDLIIAADSGAEAAMRFGFIPNIVVGDFDSLLETFHEDLIKQEVECITASAEKDETDTQLAVNTAIQKGATKISILGGVIGNRLDHVVANIFLSGYKKEVAISFVNGNQQSFIAEGPTETVLSGRKGDLLSLIPISKKVEKITTEHLQYQLKNESLVFSVPRGISNVFVQNMVRVSFTRGTMLFVHTMLTEKDK